jgi:L-malate glycosyltransferase
VTPLRIGLCCHSTLGGSSVVAAELANALARRGREIHVISAQRPSRIEAESRIRFHGVATPSHPLLTQGDFALALASRLAEVARLESLDLLHVHYALPLAVSAFLARQIRASGSLRLITTVHGTDVLTLGREPAFQPMLQLALRASDAVTAPTAFLARAAHDTFGLDRVPDIVPNFVDAQRFVPNERLGGRKTLIHHSNFRSIKRVQDAVAVLAAVRRWVDCDLVLVGDGPERRSVEAIVEQFQVRDWVRFAGEQHDVVQHLQQASVFLMPSELESFGLAALEAMSCGVPVVVSAVGGLIELVDDGVTGFLHPVGDIEAMAGSVRRLLEDAELHQRVSRAAREVAAQRWTPEKAFDAYERVYERVMRSPTP